MTTLGWVLVIVSGMGLFSLVGLMLATGGASVHGTGMALGLVRFSSGASGGQGWGWWPLTYVQRRLTRQLSA